MNKNTKKGGDMKRVYLIGSIVVGIFFVLISFPKGQDITPDFDLTPEESTPSKKEEPKKPSITPKPIIPSTPTTTPTQTPTSKPTTTTSDATKITITSTTTSETELERLSGLWINNGNPSGGEIFNDYLYVAMNESWSPIVVYDIKDPKNPYIIKYAGGHGWPVRCRVIDNKWLWSFFPNGESIFDISNPADPKPLDPTKDPVPNIMLIEKVGPKEWKPEYLGKKFIGHPWLSYSTSVHKNIMYYGTREDPSRKDPVKGEHPITLICDISNPKDPKLLSTVEGEGCSPDNNNLLFTGGHGVTYIYDVSNPSSPKKLAELKLEDVPELASLGVTDVGFGPYVNGILYGSIKRPIKYMWGKSENKNPNIKEGGTIALEMKDWNSKPKLLGYYILEGEVSSRGGGLYHKGHLFAIDPTFGVRVFDVRDPKNIKLVGADREGGELSAVAYIPSKKLLCIGQNITGGFVFVDVSDPKNPKIVSELSVAPSRIWGYMAVYKDRYLYAQGDFRIGRVAAASHLFGIDLQDPKNPKLVCAIPEVGRSYGAVCVDNYLYMCAGEIFDISDPENPKRLNVKLPVGGYQIIARKPYLYIGQIGEKGGFYIVDITEKENPKLVGKIEPLPGAHRVVSMSFLGKYVMLGWGGNVIAVDVSDPKNPVIAAKWGGTEIGFGELKEVWSDGKYLFVGAYHRNLAQYEVKEEGETLSIKQLKWSWVPAGWQIYGDAERKLIFRIGLGGIRIFRYK